MFSSPAYSSAMLLKIAPGGGGSCSNPTALAHVNVPQALLAVDTDFELCEGANLCEIAPEGLAQKCPAFRSFCTGPVHKVGEGD